MEAMGQGNAREGYGEMASKKDLEHGAMAFSKLAIQTALCAQGEIRGSASKVQSHLSFFIFITECLIHCEMYVCKNSEKTKVSLLSQQDVES